ncbi:hypothetical protein ACROYT_G036591 [Oculina patagonica]
MPHLKVNVNGKRYTISGLTRGTCSKQILCALAKVDAELQATQAFAGRSEPQKDVSRCACEEQCKQPIHVRESRKKSKREEKSSTRKDTDLKGKDGKKSTVRKTRSTNLKKSVESDSKGIQTSSGMLEALETVAESQQSCLPTLQQQEDLKEKVLEECLQTVEGLNGGSCGRDGEHAENKKASAEDQAKDTDHDTGISELHSDSSLELNQMLHNTAEKGDVVQKSSEEKSVNCTSPILVKCASTNTDPMEPVDTTDARMPESETLDSPDDDFIVAQLIGSETDNEIDDECTCVYVDSSSEEFREEIEKVRGDLKLTEAKLAQQNKMIETLNSLIDTDELHAKECSAIADVTDDVTADVNKRIDELKQSIKLSNQLYDYQKLETQANALELDKVETQIRRKRWHVQSLLKELHNARKNSLEEGGQGRCDDYLRDGTLV